MASPSQKPGGPRPSAFDPAQPATQSLGDAVRYNEALAREVSGLEEQVEFLKVRYDQWFMGLERREPTREREELKREVARLKGTFTRNTGLRFRIQSLHARFISYERMWQRCAREKEQGTYRRDVLRARRAAEKKAKEAAAEAASAPAAAPSGGADAPAAAAPAVAAPAAAPKPPRAPAAASPPPAASPVPGMTAAQLSALHSAYVDAKKRCNEDASRFTIDALAKSLAKQVPELLARFQATTVEFRVAIQDGRTVLKAVPRT